MSANEYMETVTSFSASLLASMNNDTAAAAEKANVAITDMSDNANKMGTDISLIQNAYNGFAKQNYTMLDNLKLGYGGTKEEMQRLLDDASKLSGIKYDISSYSDVVDAIHVVQTEMGITGTTAKEASTTIEGSVSSMSSAWDNWVAGMADSEANFSQLTSNLVDSIVTVVGNIAPRVIETVPRLVSGLGEIVEQLATYIPQVIQELLPPLMSGVQDLLNTLVGNDKHNRADYTDNHRYAAYFITAAFRGRRTDYYGIGARYRTSVTYIAANNRNGGYEHCNHADRKYTVADYSSITAAYGAGTGAGSSAACTD